MHKVAWVLVAVVWIGVVGVGFGRTTSVAHACSVGENFDAVTESDLIVIGQITAWTPRPELAVMQMFTPVELTIEVWSVAKGSAGSTLTAIDPASYAPDNRPLEHKPLYRDEWIGDAGACGAFDFEPLDAYVILGLKQLDDGTYRASRPLAFYAGLGDTSHRRVV